MKHLVPAIALLLAGCAAGGPDRPTVDASIPMLRIVADADANRRRPVAVDVVRVADAATARRIGMLDAATWFRERAALHGEAAGRIAIASWEIVAGQSVAVRSLPPVDAPPSATVIFARYGTPGAHRHLLDGTAALDVRLERDGFTVTPLPKEIAP
ncbi:hypothetical protein ABMY26_01230 [Azospirillum sp. HJ39]|uniref:hypothetical protein n=1 Tax=Azospirillum sp. HJ39 TaxID=3159496 RepID=UPI003557BBF7